MDVIDHPANMQARALEWRARGGLVGFTPTMGFLHAGHVSLFHRTRKILAAESGDRPILNVASVFVNPLQFNDPRDFAAYPIDIPGDLAKCEAAGIDVVYLPRAEHLYPPGFQTFVVPGALADGLCGAGRPGHFRGVTTVVAKLFHVVLPHVACFGEKDYQQLAIIRRMVRDLDMAVRIEAGPTLREQDGLAMSSRNARLSPEARAAAQVLYRALSETAARVANEGPTAPPVATLLAQAEAMIRQAGAERVEYVSVVDADDLTPMPPDAPLVRPARMAVAAFFGGVRLIDNLALIPPPSDTAALSPSPSP